MSTGTDGTAVGGTLVGDWGEDGAVRFKLLLDTLPHIAFAIFSGGRAEYYNQAFIDYVGVRPGADMASRTALHHPDDQPVLEAARAEGTAAGREYIVEARIRRFDGMYRWHRIHNRPLFHGGRRIGSIGTAVDIHDVRQANEALEDRVGERTTELLASESRYRMLYNRTPMALHSVDNRARLIDVNDTWTDLFGWSRDQVIGRSPSEFMTPESAAQFRLRSWPAMLASGGGAQTHEYQFITQSGRVFDGRLIARGEFDPAGAFVRSWSAIADVTAEKRAQHDLRQVHRMEAVGQLTAGIAHDFNNLITAILGNLELLLRRPAALDDRAERLIQGARTAAERGARLTAQLLAFSRQQPVVVEPIDCNRLVEGMRSLLQSTIGATVQIEVCLEPELWPALADATQLELALLNLAINARDAMPQGGTLTITTSNQRRGRATRPEEPSEGEFVCIEVADTGSGIPDQVRERIFEPFFTTKEIGKGSGLGLSQVLGVLQQLDGGLAVRSAPGQGSGFALFLPRTTAMATTDAPSPSIADGPDARRLRIVLVDDDPAVRAVVAEMLRDTGHEILELGSGAEALLHLEQDCPDLLLADLAMPGMSGVELASGARLIWPTLPVLFMTGFAEENLMPSQSTWRVVRKPFDARTLTAEVARVAASPPDTD
ncbi:MAG: PAS domain-containing protein [Acetobacteraceae bacterium]